MRGEPANPSSPQDDPSEVAARLRQQMTRLKRWFQWERWLMEPRSFAPPDDMQDGDMLDGAAPDDDAGERAN